MKKLILLSLLALVSCRTGMALLDVIVTTPYRFSSTDDKNYKYQSTYDCTVKVMSEKPSSRYYEIGVIEYFESEKYPAKNTLSSFKTEIQSLVCNNGGHLVVAKPNNEGLYLYGTVYRKRTE